MSAMFVGTWNKRGLRMTCCHAVAMSTSHTPVSLNPKVLAKWREEFIADPKNELAQKGFTNPSNAETYYYSPPVKVNFNSRNHPLHVFNHRVAPKNKPITAQKQSGRCWLFSSLNAMRLPFMRKYGIDAFEFSQSYLYFYGRIELGYCWLVKAVKLAKEGHRPGDESFIDQFERTPNDGGMWPNFKDLINKYGVIPKDVFPETYNSSNTAMYNNYITAKLYESTKELVDIVAKGVSDDVIQAALDRQIDVIHKLSWTCIGSVPEKFKFEYYRKDGSYQSFPEVTPLEFYDQFVRPTYDVNNKVYLSNYPYTEYNEQYSSDSPKHVVGAPEPIYNNQPIETLLKATTASLIGNEPVFFVSCESFLDMDRSSCFDLNEFDHKLALNTDFNETMTKKLKMMYRITAPNHGMVFTAVKTDENGAPEKFLVENSWGEKAGINGMFLLTEAWFRLFVLMVVVDKKFVPQNVLDVHNRPLKRLDPFGPNIEIVKPIIPDRD